ncbi:MAG: hypothetical protein Greene101449_431 [Candidatus Peregrinibacteria bacterium Greene1014_49]|nr:MAG: hypothetical protein Greene101449_431 [Candidatus Peregrinibacteria bacterium Greene1014_49]
MKNRSTFVAALAGLLVGTAVGAGTYYSAQLVSYRYSDVDGSREQYHRSENSPTDRASIRTVDSHSAAEAQASDDPCADVHPRRKARCIEAMENDIDYTGAQYDEN